jgi:hypothetical protein
MSMLLKFIEAQRKRVRAEHGDQGRDKDALMPVAPAAQLASRVFRPRLRQPIERAGRAGGGRWLQLPHGPDDERS